MSSIAEIINERQKELVEMMNPIIQRWNERGKELVQRGNGLLMDLQEKHSAIYDRSQAAIEDAREISQRAIVQFEEAVLVKSAALLGWSYEVTGGRSVAIKRSLDFITDRLTELEGRKVRSQQDLAPEGEVAPVEPVEMTPEDTAAFMQGMALHQAMDEALDKAHTFIEEGESVEEPAEEVSEEADAEAPKEESQALPIEDYDELTAKAVIEMLDDLSHEELTAVMEYETANKNRKTVLEAIEKLMN